MSGNDKHGGKEKGGKHADRGGPEVSVEDIDQAIEQVVAQESVQANLAIGNTLRIDLSGSHNHANLNKATIVLRSEIDQENASDQSSGQYAGNHVSGVVYDKHGRAIAEVEVEGVAQSVDQSASQDSAQLNAAIGNVLTVDLSGEHNHANMNKVKVTLVSDIEQSNFSYQHAQQDAGNDLYVTAYGEGGGEAEVEDVAQSVAQDTTQSSEQANYAIGNVFAVDLSGEHNHVNLNKAEITLVSAIDQSNTSDQEALQGAWNSASASDYAW